MKLNRKLAGLLAGTQLLMLLASCDSNSTQGGGTTGGDTTVPDTGLVGSTPDSSDSSSSSSSTASSGSDVAKTTEAKSEFDIENMEDVYMETVGLAGDTVIATAGDFQLTVEEILGMTLQELDTMAMYEMYGMGSIPWGEDAGSGEIYDDYVMRTATEFAILYRIFPLIAEQEGLSLPTSFSEETEAYLESVLLDLGGDEQAFQYVLWQAGTTVDAYVTNSGNTSLANLIMDKFFGTDGTMLPSDEQILEEMENLGMYRVKHILLSTIDDTGASIGDDAKAERLAEAEAIIAELEAAGDDLDSVFHEMMLELSEDPGSTSQPDGYSATLGMMVTEFEEASLALEVGGLSEPVESSFGYHIIYRLPLVADETQMETIINELAVEMQDGWLAEYPLELTDAYHEIDVKVFYENLTLLREHLQVLIEESKLVGTDDAE